MRPTFSLQYQGFQVLGRVRHADTCQKLAVRGILAKLPVEPQPKTMADFPSGQRDLTVNQALRASVVRIHYPPRLDSSVVEHFLGKEEVVSPILTRGSLAG